MTNLFEIVQKLRSLGLCVIPSGGGKDGKHPLGRWKHRQKKPPTEEEYQGWFKRKLPFYGFVTGAVSRIFVVDEDPGADPSVMEGLEPNVRTPRGGGHYWVALPDGYTVETQVGILTGIDIRGEGGFANCVGVNPKAKDNSGEYEILSEAAITVDQLPEILKEKLTVKEISSQEEGPLSKTGSSTLIPEGKRNDWLFRRDCGYRNKGDDEEAIFKKSKIDYEERCVHEPPMSDKELRAMAHSAFKYEPSTGVHRSDTGNATILVDRYGDRLRYDHRQKRWLRWGKHRWEADADGYVSRLVQEVAKERYRRAVAIEDDTEKKREFAWAVASEHRNRVDACVALAKIMKPISDEGTNWDRNITLLGAPNGVVDLRTGDLRPGKAEDRITMSTGVRFDPDAKCPRWEKFLSEIFDDNEKLIDWLWRVLGYSIIGETIEQIFMVGYGEGSNGKSKFFEAVGNALGDYAYYTPFATFSKPAPSSYNDLAALECRRFVTSSETNIGTRLNIERIKAISGGDKITARYLYREFETYQPHLKLWLFVNHLPDVEDDTIATWRRVRLIPFTKTFIREAEDKHLGNKLKAEAEGILAWLVKGCLEWQSRGLAPVPECIRAATGEYRRETDTMISFINDRCVKSEDEEIRARQLYSAYKSWAEGTVNKNKILTETMFGRQMGKRYEKRVDRRGIHYLGITLADKGIYVDLSRDD